MSWTNEIDGHDLLNAHLKTSNAGGMPIAWENTGKTPGAKPYLRESLIYGQNQGKSLSGKEELDAVYQVDLVTGRGDGAVPDTLATVTSWFPAGLKLTKTGGYVRVRRTQIGAKVQEGDGFFFPLSITVKIQEEG
jgi:hypothetical protein